MVAPYAVPVGFLFGTLAVVGRLSADSEVVAMRACGLGLGTLFAPVLAIAIAVTAVTAVGMIRVEPAARGDVGQHRAQLAARSSSRAVSARSATASSTCNPATARIG